MKILFSNRWLYICITLFVIALVFAMMAGVGNKKDPTYTTTQVETGPVRQLVSVSGIAEANQSAKLAFPVSGVVQDVRVRAGDTVSEGTVLVTLDTAALYADRQEASAAVASAIASRNELLNGPTKTAQSITSEAVATKELALEATRQIETEKVKNAYRTFLSSDLTAYTKNTNDVAVAPTISGTYECETEGTYELDVFSSAAISGYSYRLSGIEHGTFEVSTEQPSPMGSCGLFLQFDDASRYGRSNWTIEIPNTKSTSYTTNQNAYNLTKTQAETALKNAEQAIVVVEADATNQNAPAREEAVARADAAVAQARARLSRIDTAIADRALTAPFTGTITNIDILPGETVTAAPILTILAEADFEVTARIPEIDIGKLLTGQKTELVFDARPEETLTGEVRFISLEATEIDGVAYYEAFITLDKIPDWMRSGLNADIEIIISETIQSLRIPKRFLTSTDTGHVVTSLQADGSLATTTVELLLTGNDGFVAITGVNDGDIIVAP